ncbi:phosphotransferase family protein [Paenibacillus agilis]|uniref:Aminoglycoside phosphotransferase family protein n=1 Tax=Paenibacillus agilis TaxID=3020863 RepID=A0A559IWR1_9BACL|nr:aminoglycoside phosphotransferase family protein [Paenibacillus agilis]TVX92069.1 aminoglycoside phosphotransferase family protein [Paenibacillus agilis]
MIASYKGLIEQKYPELVIEHIEPNAIGQNNDVVMINNSLVFRFPKYEEGIRQLKREIELLKVIHYQATLPIPLPKYVSFEAMVPGQVFTGYKLIAGAPFWKEELDRVQHKEARHRIASQLVTFLIELHGTKWEQVEPIFKQERKSILEMVKQLYEDIEKKLFSYMRNDARERVIHNFRTFLDNEKNHNVQQTLIHGDFGTGNILWDAEACAISGVIDFGGSGLGDPAYDLAGILAGYGEEFYEECIRLYPGGEDISERVRFYRSTFALQEALHGVDNNDPEAFECGMKEYR